MKVQKYEISRTIDKLKSIVQKNDQFPALGGVLVKDGYLIASNTEMTMQLKLEASKSWLRDSLSDWQKIRRVLWITQNIMHIRQNRW